MMFAVDKCTVSDIWQQQSSEVACCLSDNVQQQNAEYKQRHGQHAAAEYTTSIHHVDLQLLLIWIFSRVVALWAWVPCYHTHSIMYSGIIREGGGRRTALGDTIQGVTPEWDLIFCGPTDKDWWKKNVRTWGSKKGYYLFRGRWLKMVVRFFRKK